MILLLATFAYINNVFTGISEQTVTKIRAEYKEKGVFSTPKKRYARLRFRVEADSFDRDAMRKKIHLLYKNKENLSLKKILVSLTECFDGVNRIFPCIESR